MLHPSHFFLPWKKGCKSLETGQSSWMSRERPRTSGTNLDIFWATEERQQLPTNHFKLSTFFYFTILYWFCHTSIWIHHGCTRVPHPDRPPTSLPIPSLWVIPVHQPQASCLMHRTWTGDLFHIWYYTCFNAILPNHPTLSLSHRVQKTVLDISVSFAVSHTGLLLPSF